MRHLLASSLLTILTMALAAPSPLSAAGPCASPGFTAPRPLVARASGILAADVDGDGDIDLLTSLVASGPTYTPALLENTGREHFGPPTPLPARPSALLAATGDFDADGRLDVLLTRSATRTVSVLLGDGRGGFTESAESDAGASGSTAAGDLDGDGRLDAVIVGRDPADGTRWVLSFLKGDGGGGFEAPVLQRVETINPHAVTAADLDGDGRAELLITFTAHRCGWTTVYRRDAHGTFVELPGARVFGAAFVLADINLDGILDSVGTCSHFGYGLEVALGNGDGTFTRTVSRQVGSYGYTGGAVVADFDGDGKPDVMAIASSGTYFYRGDGNGGLGAETMVFPMEELLLAADLDGDTLADLVTGRFDGTRDIRLNTCGRPAGAEATFLVPFLYRGSGANGAVFTPDLLLVNRGDTTATLEASYTATIGSGSSRGSSILPGGVQRSSGFSDLGVSVSAAQGTWGGTLRLRFSGLASPYDAFALAGIASGRSGDSEVGGVALPAIPLSDTLSGPAVVAWLREDARDRTNLVLINAGDEADEEVVLRVTVVSTDLTRPGSAPLPVFRLAPGAAAQVDRVLLASGLGATSGLARIERLSGASRYGAYAVVNDNGSSDGSVVPPLAAGRRAGQTVLVVPALVESGAFDSELILTNASPSPRRLNLSWTSEGLSTPDHTARLTIDLPPSEQLYVPSFVAWLRELGVAGVGAPGGSYAGALFVSGENGDVEGIFAGGRISSAGRAGRYGVFMAASSLAELATEEAWVYGLAQRRSQPAGNFPGLRTNLAIVNAGETPSGFRVDLFDSGGAAVGSLEDVVVGARGWLQIPSILLPFFGASQQSMSAYARIRRVSGSGPFLTYGVLNQGAGPGVGSGDGRILPMRTTASSSRSDG